MEHGIVSILHELVAWFEGPDGNELIELVVTPRGYNRIARVAYPLLRHPNYLNVAGDARGMTFCGVKITPREKGDAA